MSSHREAPEISKDPVADSTDVYAFVSPDKPDTVTLIANYVPLQAPAGGPNFYAFGDDVQYDINVDNTGTGQPNVIYRFNFQDVITNPNTFLYNTGPISSLTDMNFNRRQTYTVTRIVNGTSTVLGSGLPCPPCNIGPLSTPNYAGLATSAIKTLSDGSKVYAGQRAEGFYVDLGAIFDLGDLRPLQQLHAHFGLAVPELTRASPGINATKNVNVYTIAIQVAKTSLTPNGSNPTDPSSSSSVIGVWTSASRQAARMYADPTTTTDGEETVAGPFYQVSRLGNPLFNEVLVPIGTKDFWNTQPPAMDSQFAKYVANPELATLLPVLYPGAFPNLDAYNKSGKARADLEAILLTGIPSGIIPGFQNVNGNGKTQADELRLNMAISPNTSKPSNLGLVGGDAAGFPNGRRVFDDVTTIELQAIAGATLPLVDKSYTADKAVSAVTQGLTANANDTTGRSTESYLSTFPYLGTPYAGYDIPDNDVPAPTSSY
ncbi:MAG: DUF4331 domain-containing protein [Acidimicrobiales bacterium]